MWDAEAAVVGQRQNRGRRRGSVKALNAAPPPTTKSTFGDRGRASAPIPEGHQDAGGGVTDAGNGTWDALVAEVEARAVDAREEWLNRMVGQALPSGVEAHRRPRPRSAWHRLPSGALAIWLETAYVVPEAATANCMHGAELRGGEAIAVAERPRSPPHQAVGGEPVGHCLTRNAQQPAAVDGYHTSWYWPQWSTPTLVSAKK